MATLFFDKSKIVIINKNIVGIGEISRLTAHILCITDEEISMFNSQNTNFTIGYDSAAQKILAVRKGFRENLLPTIALI